VVLVDFVFSVRCVTLSDYQRCLQDQSALLFIGYSSLSFNAFATASLRECTCIFS
jgi:hypothetical protein